MAEIRIEASSVQVLGTDLFLDHLYLVFVDDNDSEFVIRGGPIGESRVNAKLGMEIGVPITESADDRPVEDRADFGSRVIDLGGRDANDVWEQLKKSAQQIDDASLRYISFSQNSNSTVGAMLKDVGIFYGDVLPNVPGIDIYVAVSNLLNFEYERHISIEQASDGPDFLLGAKLEDRIYSGAGDDVIFGGDSHDKLFGGAGDDIVMGGYGPDVIRGQEGNDLIFAAQYSDIGGGQNDFGDTSSSSDTFGNRGNDILVADNSGLSLNGGANHDLLVGGTGDDILNGGGGRDYIITGGGADEVRGGKGNDWINALAADSDAIVFFDADSGHDYIEQAADGSSDNGVSEIRFEGLTTDDVSLVWDYDIVSSDINVDYNGEQSLSQELSGEAYIRVNSTGATINIGTVEGDVFLFPASGQFTDPFVNFALTANMQNNHILVFDDMSSSPTQPTWSDNLVFYDTANLFGVTLDLGLISFDDLNYGDVGRIPNNYSNAPDRFVELFDNPFIDDNALLTGGETDIANLLSEDTISTLTDDVFALA